MIITALITTTIIIISTIITTTIFIIIIVTIIITIIAISINTVCVQLLGSSGYDLIGLGPCQQIFSYLSMDCLQQAPMICHYNADMRTTITTCVDVIFIGLDGFGVALGNIF